MRVFGVEDFWFLDTVRMPCTRCGKRFRLTDPGVTKQLPIDVKATSTPLPASKWGASTGAPASNASRKDRRRMLSCVNTTKYEWPTNLVLRRVE